MPLSVAFWGTRGSIPSPGPATVRYGGNTSCLELLADGPRRLILDAGTGLRRLGRHLVTRRAEGPLDLTLLLTHTHWDHIQGLPFFLPLFRAGDVVRIFGPGQPPHALATILTGLMEPSVFPVPLTAVNATLEVTEIEAVEFQVAGFSISAIRACHPGVCYGYSVTPPGGEHRVIYLTDNELSIWRTNGVRSGLVRFLRGSHTLVHDAMYSEAQVRERSGWGHSSVGEAVLLALDAECRRLALFHHDPDHDDVALEQLLDEALEIRARHGGALEIVLAAEGETLRC